MKDIITISGSARHGKDTTANFLKEKLEAKGYKVLILHFGDLLKYYASQYFKWDGNKDIAGRKLLQELGTDIVRSRCPDFWVESVYRFIDVFQNDYDFFIIPDSRFPNEVNFFVNHGMDVTPIKVIRKNFESNLTDEQKNHLSERALDNYVFDYYIENLDGFENLEKEVNKFLNWYFEG